MTDPRPSPRGAPRGTTVALGLSALATLAFAVLARERGAYFRGDDYTAFYGVVTQSMRQFLLTPIDVHFIPLHKLATWSIYRIAPLNFDLALVMMCVFHLLSLWMLYRTLELLGAGRLSAPLTVLCGTNMYFAVLLLNWSAGIARFPYILLAIAAVYQYLRFRRSRSLGRLAAIVGCVVGASAFFSKGLLIPGFLAAVELAFLPETSRRDLGRNVGAIALTAGAAVAYRLLSNHFVSAVFQSPPIHWRDQLVAFETVAMILHQGVFGLYPERPLTVGNWLIVLLWIAFFAATLRASRFNAVVWLLALVTLIVNFLIITLSPRMVLGPIVVTAERYYFDVIFLVVLFAAILLRRSLPAAPSGNLAASRAAVAAAWLGVLVSAAVSWHTFERLLDSPRYSEEPFARTYANNLRADLTDIRRTQPGTLDFAEGVVPQSVLSMAVLRVGKLSKFLLVFDSRIRVLPRGNCLYVVQPDGTIARPPEGCTT